jgi:DNA topoisomerase-3
MKRFAVSIARQKGLKPPPGYTKSGSICRAFLDQHAPKKAGGETAGEFGPKPASPAQMSFAEKIAQENGIVIPDETKSSMAAMSAWIESNQGTARGKRSRKTANKPPRSTAPMKRARRRTNDNAAAPPIPARQNSGTDTPLRIPYGNKDDALKLGARYRSGGWYAPPGVDLAAFGERGWL